MGTVLAFEPDGSGVEVVADGLRNVYDIAFDRDGRLFGADTDGPTVRSKQWDTLYHIVEGGYYGFPEYGTFDAGAFDDETRDPLWVFDRWPSGIEAADATGFGTGVLVGLRQAVVFVPIAEDTRGLFVPDAPRTVANVNNVPTVVEAGPDESLYVASFRDEKLGILRSRGEGGS
jgi:glucose/arabinose dehydrogenase